jgi:branched-chain amino acid transport system ATP-binding protein
MARELTVNGLTAGYGNSTVLQNVELTVEPGTICGILGRNGVGKTTLIQALAGHLPVRKGKVSIGGRDVTHLAAHKRAEFGMALAPQGRRLFPSLTVREHLQIAERRNGNPDWLWDFEAVTNSFPRLAERLGNLGSELSGGEQSMVSMGRLLIANPHVALLDEPSEGLSPLLVQKVSAVLRQAKDGGMTILIVEQNYGLVMEIADRVHLMNKGQIVYSGTPAELKDDTEIRRRYLGG